MATTDLISSFLSNEMSPDRERQFLLSVAASDSLRLELKSHMVLDRILMGQAQRAHVPDAIRASILAAAGAAAAAPVAAPSASHGRWARIAGRGAIFVAAALCFGTGYYLGDRAEVSASAPTVVRTLPTPTVSTPTAGESTPSTASPATRVSPAAPRSSAGTPRELRSSQQTRVAGGASGEFARSSRRAAPANASEARSAEGNATRTPEANPVAPPASVSVDGLHQRGPTDKDLVNPNEPTQSK